MGGLPFRESHALLSLHVRRLSLAFFLLASPLDGLHVLPKVFLDGFKSTDVLLVLDLVRFYHFYGGVVHVVVFDLALAEFFDP